MPTVLKSNIYNMSEKRLLLGDEAVALGALHAGLSGVYSYPGTPSTEVTEFIQAHAPQVRSRWCTNEKTAMEAALGMSYAGKRALVCMKHVGMNVCADAFVNSAVTGVNGGIVVLAAPKFLISIVPFAVGVVVLVNGIVNLAQALDQRRMGYGRWSFSLALAVLTIVLGVLVICNPFSTMEMLVMAIGIVVAYNGLSNLWIESRYRKL